MEAYRRRPTAAAARIIATDNGNITGSRMLFVCIRTEWAGEKAAKGGRNWKRSLCAARGKAKVLAVFARRISTCLP